MAYDSTAFWSRVSKFLMNTSVPFLPTIVTRAKGTLVYDVDNKAIFDFSSGQMSAFIGHSHPEIVEVVRKHMGEPNHLNSQMVSIPVIDLAEDLARILLAPFEEVNIRFHRFGVDRSCH
jgi:4-aminobutyrate aminotransferase-like enzyme